LPELSSPNGLVCFGAFEVDVRAGELRKHRIRIKLQDQPFRVLQILLEHPGEAVSRAELQRQIWPSDTFVDFERGLNNAVRRLREALGDSADAPRYVETLAKHGYRFIATVEKRKSIVEVAASTDGTIEIQRAKTRSEPRFRFRVGLIAALGLFALAGALFALDAQGWRSKFALKLHPPIIESLAVLPLRNLSGDPAQEYFADGMTDGLITELAQISSVRVISHTSVTRYKKTDKTLPEIARELNVDGIIEGTVQREGDRVRISAQLLYAPLERHVWADTYERELRDVFSLERDLTQDIARQIKGRLSAQSQTVSAQTRSVNLKALEAYLLGKHHLDRVGQGFADEEADKAIEYFRQAINADPSFLPAYIGLTDANNWRLLPSHESDAMMESARKKIAELAPNSAVAALASARVKEDNWDWAGAEAEYRTAIALDPNNVEAHSRFASFLDDLARLDEGWKEWQAAQELNPNPDRLPSALNLPQALAIRGKCDQAIPLILRIIEGNPNDGQTHLQLSDCYYKTANYQGRIEELGKAAASYGHPEIETHLKQAYAANGHQAALRQWERELEHLQATKQVYMPAYLATIYGELGEKEKVFYWLEEAYRSHMSGGVGSSMVHSLKTDSSLELIRNDPRYFDLLRRAGLPAEPSLPARY
jgi:TolB-like protein/DNA-binding winged helix-turn-helix (wHTH) protein/tetratricopeptide (TPR) repeat protein